MKTAIALLLWLAVATSGNAAVVTFEVPAGAPFGVGDIFDVKLVGKGFGVAIDGGGAEVLFPSSILELKTVTVAPIWEFASSPGTIDNGSGKLTGLIFNTFVNTNQGNFDIASLSFAAKAPGIANLSVGGNPLFPFASGGFEQIPTFQGATVVVAVPEPEQALLLMVGLMLVALRVRRARSSVNS